VRTLVVPDVHEQISRLRKILTLFGPPLVDRVVFLGDLFDSFESGRTEAMVEWFRDAVHEQRYRWCIGNHDLHYMTPYCRGFECSGYTEWKDVAINHRVDVAHWRSVARLSIPVGRYLLSHAGYHPTMVKYREVEGPALRLAYADNPKKIIPPVLSFSGRRESFGLTSGDPGGPTWMDWADFEDIPGLPQIVGHTPDTTVRQKGESFCLDTMLHHVGIIEDDGPIQVVAVD
jgi:hypothetical protein